MSIVPILKSAELISALTRAGFKIIRQSGSHVRLRNIMTGRSTTVPMHNYDIPRWLLKVIIKQAGVTLEQLLKLLGKL